MKGRPWRKPFPRPSVEAVRRPARAIRSSAHARLMESAFRPPAGEAQRLPPRARDWCFSVPLAKVAVGTRPPAARRPDLAIQHPSPTRNRRTPIVPYRLPPTGTRSHKTRRSPQPAWFQRPERRRFEAPDRCPAGRAFFPTPTKCRRTARTWPARSRLERTIAIAAVPLSRFARRRPRSSAGNPRSASERSDGGLPGRASCPVAKTP